MPLPFRCLAPVAFAIAAPAFIPLCAQTVQSSRVTGAALSPALAALRDAPLEELARAVPPKDSAYVRTLLTASDTNERAMAGNRIASDSGAIDFTLGLLLREKKAKVMTYTMRN